MAKQFEEQGGAATMDPSPLLRWGTSRLMTRLSQAKTVASAHRKAEAKRVKAGRPHVVEYFHQVDDGYSHLAAQILQRFAQRYDVQLDCHLVSGPLGKNSAEPELLLQLSRYDAHQVANYYGLQFDEHPGALPAALLKSAQSILANLDSTAFVRAAADVGSAMWKGDAETLAQLAEQQGHIDAAAVAAKIEAGNTRRHALKHYSGAMFYYEGEWYWGVDRLYHLEQRLAELGADNNAGAPKIVPRPEIETGPLKDNGSLTLEVFPSLRSPYTSISFDRTLELAARTGVNLVVRPVLPMVMRGVPATRQKGMYIFLDTAREARAAGVPYGNFYDPIGEPVRRAYSLYPWAKSQGKGNALLSAFLRCAFAQGVNMSKEAGLRKAVVQAGLDWQAAQTHLGDPGWEKELETNRQAMYESGLWGVPSLRLSRTGGDPLLSLWGQDRLWLFAQRIQEELQAAHS